MNNILGIVGSPRKKGNTHLLVSAIMDGAESEGASAEIVFLSDDYLKIDILSCYLGMSFRLVPHEIVRDCRNDAL